MPVVVDAGAYLHHIQLQSGDPGGLAAFYADVMDMDSTALGAGDWICQGPGRRILFTRGDDKKLGFAAFACRDAGGLAAIRAKATQENLELFRSPSPLFGPDAFAVRDPDHNVIVFGLSEPAASRKGLKAPLQHLTLATENPEALEHFYGDQLGFLASDYVRDGDGRILTCWMRSNHEHHTLAYFRHKHQGVDHHSYEAGDWALIKDWCDRMGERRIPIMWGPGRHGPGNNIFIFIEDPAKNWIEISAELEVMYDRPAKNWPHEEHTLNSWGRGILRM